METLPRLMLVDGYLDAASLPRLYKAADCFVLPSRGEGWGRPHVEAMSMELPVIATDWSGPQEFLNSENGYPLPIDGFSTIPKGAFRGHQWANPSVPGLRLLMRHVMTNPVEAKGCYSFFFSSLFLSELRPTPPPPSFSIAKGKKARSDMVTKYHPDVVSRHIVDRVLEIEKIIKSKRHAEKSDESRDEL